MFNPSPMQQPAQRPMPPQAPPQQPPATGSNFTMNEVPDLTSKLSMLPSSSLQQFAQLHKGDPYIMALVMSESNRRKKLQQAGMQPQGEAPKVVDQMISSLALPEEQGIAQIPAPNMAHMADGGIAGYAGDGEQGQQVDEAAQGLRSTDGGKTWFFDLPSTVRDPRVPYYKEIPNTTAKAVSGTKFGSREEALQAYRRANMLGTPELPKALMADKASYGPSLAEPQTPPAAPTGAKLPARPVVPTPSAAGAPAAAAPAAAAPGITSLAPAPMTAADAMNAAQQFVKPGADQLKADLSARQDRVKQENEQNLADYQKGLGALPKAYEGYEERLKAQEAGAGQEKEDAKGMAIFKAGLAIMAGSSPNALQNIGKGAMVGAEDYQGALKDFKKAALERDKAFADIENARLAYKRDDMKTAQALKERGQDRLDRVDDKMGDIAAKMFGTTTEIGAGIYRSQLDNQNADRRLDKQLASSEKIAGNQIANQLAIAKMPGTQEKLFAALDPTGKGNVGAGFKAYTEATSEGRGDQAILAAYAKDPNALAMLKDTNPTLYNMVTMRLNAQMMPGTVSAPAAGQVRAP